MAHVLGLLPPIQIQMQPTRGIGGCAPTILVLKQIHALLPTAQTCADRTPRAQRSLLLQYSRTRIDAPAARGTRLLQTAQLVYHRVGLNRVFMVYAVPLVCARVTLAGMAQNAITIVYAMTTPRALLDRVSVTNVLTVQRGFSAAIAALDSMATELEALSLTQERARGALKLATVAARRANRAPQILVQSASDVMEMRTVTFVTSVMQDTSSILQFSRQHLHTTLRMGACPGVDRNSKSTLQFCTLLSGIY
mmetsp:Transcript_12371/g.31638  ORF Transcript_12371/g.31638 Transcript_12371/m.31638 type:complete len:251 (-) Transcript_12371:2583-3335(-)